MKKEKNVFKLLKLFINVIYIIFIFIIVDGMFTNVGFDEWLDLDFGDFMGRFLLLMIIWLVAYFLVSFISVLWHEFGHYVFGKKAKLNFDSFSVLNLVIYKEKNKTKFKFSKRITGVSGFCNMGFDDNKKYNPKDVISYYFGGIFFNMIFVVVFSILLLLCKNDYLYLLCLLFISVNVYTAFYNMIPVIKRNGVRSDMMHIVIYFEDDEFTKIYGRLYKVQEYLNDGYSLKEIDKKLMYMPKTIKSSASLQMAEVYVDYLTEMEKYDDALKKIKFINEEAKDIISVSDEYILKTQEIICLFKKDKYSEIEKEWDKNYIKFIKYAESLTPLYTDIEYMYYKLIKNDKDEYNKTLSRFNKNKKLYRQNQMIIDAETFIKEIDEKYENNK